MARFRRFFVLMCLIALSGCATLVDYQPQPIHDVKEALLTLERSINLNPIKKGVMLDSADERMMKLIGALRGGAIQKIILFADIDHLTLHTKRDRFSVSIYGAGEVLQFRFYFNDRYSATRLVDALYTMKDHKPDDTHQYSIKYGENVVDTKEDAHIIESKDDFFRPSEIGKKFEAKDEKEGWVAGVMSNEFEQSTGYKNSIDKEPNHSGSQSGIIYLNCYDGSGKDEAKYSVKLDENSGKVTQSNGGYKFNADGFFTVDEITYQDISVFDGVKTTQKYTINRIDLSFRHVFVAESTQFRGRVEPKIITYTGACEIVKAKSRLI